MIKLTDILKELEVNNPTNPIIYKYSDDPEFYYVKNYSGRKLEYVLKTLVKDAYGEDFNNLSDIEDEYFIESDLVGDEKEIYIMVDGGGSIWIKSSIDNFYWGGNPNGKPKDLIKLNEFNEY